MTVTKDITTLRRLPGVLLSWWLGELAALVPQRLRRFMSSAREMLCFEFSDAEIIVSRGAGGRVEELARLRVGGSTEELRAAIRNLASERRLKRSEIVLSLPPEKFLRKTLDLPLASEPRLGDLLIFELDRQIPFEPDQVEFDYRILERDRATQRLHVELVVATRAVIDEFVQRATLWGLTPSVVTVHAGGPAAAEPEINLLSRAGREAAERGGRKTATVLTLILATLIAVAAILPLQEQGLEALAAEETLSEARNAAAEASRLRNELEQIAKARGFLAELKQNAPRVATLLADLTQTLPDETWLFELVIDGGELRARGYAPSAASILELVDRSPLYRDVRFASPVTQVPGIDRERFDLKFSIESEAAQ
jgi:general secretion pathway protein L